MASHRQRFVILAALLGTAVGGGARAEAGPVLQTPSGLKPGDAFKFVFVTDGTTQATSLDQGVYNNFVQTEAQGATYDGSGITWRALVSNGMPAQDAVDNTGGYSPVPIYLVDGTKVASLYTKSAGGMWSGSLQNAVDEDILGSPVSATVWTGTNPDGTSSSNPVGSSTVTDGSSSSTDAGWVSSGVANSGDFASLYGISTILIVPPSAVPEPSTLGMAATAFLVGLAYARVRRRR